MILSFTVENWMSFRDSTTFSMVASRERGHGERVPKVAKYPARILPIAAIYGGNASGKTNFFKALDFVRDLVIQGTKPDSLIQVDVFQLDSKWAGQSSKFTLEILVDENIYEFSFAVFKGAVLEEKLVLITSSSEKIFYHRFHGKPNFHEALERQEFLKFAFQGTRDNQLFLTNSVSQKVDEFRPIYDWFKNTLVMVAPDSRFGPFPQLMSEDHPIHAKLNEGLRQLDTGIDHLGGEKIHFDNIPLPKSIKSQIAEELKEGETGGIHIESINERFQVTRKGRKIIAKKLVTFHTKADGTFVKFEIGQESDGSQRVIDLLPAFLEISIPTSEKVYVIDEIDRSLHTILTRRLLEGYLSTCTKETRNQLLFTTHDVLLMDQKLLRRDEMWVAERDSSGASTLIPFSDFKEIRYDKDIRKRYLQGRMGGIPRILLGGALSNHCQHEENGEDD